MVRIGKSIRHKWVKKITCVSTSLKDPVLCAIPALFFPFSFVVAIFDLVHGVEVILDLC